MQPLVWLALAIGAVVGAYLVAVPAWRSSRLRSASDLNAERYRAWRGQGSPQRASAPEGMTADERRRLYAGAALAAFGLVALVAFFLTS